MVKVSSVTAEELQKLWKGWITSKIVSGSIDMRGSSRYTVIVAAAKRARQLIDGAKPLVEPNSVKLCNHCFRRNQLQVGAWYHTKEGIIVEPVETATGVLSD